MTLEDDERPLPILLHTVVFFRDHENLNEDTPIISAVKM